MSSMHCDKKMISHQTAHQIRSEYGYRLKENTEEAKMMCFVNIVLILQEFLQGINRSSI